ncbi:hypothetical protein ACQPZF_21385 [Actinosynnema sp. CS-041913]|uniref:hypothetical protein n=1 Tax=Actinosynnema sp. CS-041913 TaxID=3239917 RepID=UPI003D910822
MEGAPLVHRRVPTVLGTLEFALPAGAALEPDPGAVDGVGWWWSPIPGACVFTVSHGDAARRTPASLLTLERGLGPVEVLVDEPAPGGHLLEFRSGGRHARFRYWARGRFALRAGYRTDEACPVLDAVFDSMRLVGGPAAAEGQPSWSRR